MPLLRPLLKLVGKLADPQARGVILTTYFTSLPDPMSCLHHQVEWGFV